MGGKKYKNPPIEEAICQFTFSTPLPWNPETPRLLFEELRNRYPAMPMQQQLLRANLAPEGGIENPNLSITPVDRVVFADAENISRFSVGPQTIGVHRARPYLGFEEDMLTRIREGIPSSIGFIQQNPLFSNVSVRYINRIEIQAEELELTDYFNYSSSFDMLPRGFDGTVTGFLFRTSARHRSTSLELGLNFGSLVAPRGIAAFLLDIDLSHNFENPVDAEEAIEKVIEIKDVENSIFESFITDKTRETFG
jgi:uncharacterized protein (TIGR04255 family)